MRNNYVKNLYDSLLNDEKYKKYCEIYDTQKYIDLDLLKYLLKTHHELYYIFLKINILLYFSREEKIMKNVNNDLKDYYHSSNVMLNLNDMDLILRHYYTNFSRCKASIIKMVKYELVTKVERDLLMLIHNRGIEEQIIPILENEE